MCVKAAQEDWERRHLQLLCPSCAPAMFLTLTGVELTLIVMTWTLYGWPA